MKYIDPELYIENTEDKQLSALAANSINVPLSLNKVHEPCAIGEAASNLVLKGLAEISFMGQEYDYHGLTTTQANAMISDLSGDVEEYFTPYLKAESAKLD